MKVTKNHVLATLLFIVTGVAILEGVYIWGYVHSTVYGLSPMKYFPMSTSSTTTTSTRNNEGVRQIFTNTLYKYQFDYYQNDQSVTIASRSDGVPPSQDMSVYYGNIFEVDVVGGAQQIASIKKMIAENSNMLPQNRADLERRSALISLDLKSFTEQIHDYEVKDPKQNDWSKDKQVGPITETTVNGKKAFQFTLTRSFSGPFGGYALVGDKKYVFVVTENSSGDKFILHYVSGDPVSENMFQSFLFLK